jgi:hypothetical protein
MHDLNAMKTFLTRGAWYERERSTASLQVVEWYRGKRMSTLRQKLKFEQERKGECE